MGGLKPPLKAIAAYKRRKPVENIGFRVKNCLDAMGYGGKDEALIVPSCSKAGEPQGIYGENSLQGGTEKKLAGCRGI